MTLHKQKFDIWRTNGFTRTNSSKNLSGFTIVELMIATTVFSVILLLATFGLLQVGRTYYKGITLTKTQNVARSIIDTISQDIQFSGESVNKPDNYPTISETDPNPTYAICIGNNRYSVKLDQKVGGTYHGLLVDESNSCEPQDFADIIGTPKELLDTNMRVAKLSIDNSTNPDLYTINLTIIYGDNDLLNNVISDSNYHKQCLSAQAGTQFCSVVNLSTTVQKRKN